MIRKDFAGQGREPRALLVKWYDFTRWLLERIDSFPKNQRFVFGTRLADHVLNVLETLVQAAYSREKFGLARCCLINPTVFQLSKQSTEFLRQNLRTRNSCL